MNRTLSMAAGIAIFAITGIVSVPASAQLELQASSPKSAIRVGEPVEIVAVFQNVGSTVVYVPKNIIGDCPPGISVVAKDMATGRQLITTCNARPYRNQGTGKRDTRTLNELVGMMDSWKRIEPYGSIERSLMLRSLKMPAGASRLTLTLKYTAPVDDAERKALKAAGFIVAAREYKSNPVTVQIK